jgi:ABC-type transport system substrate-binding protein
LNPDLHFHHGAPLTCRDVEATFAQLQTIKTILPVATKIASMGCLDEHRFFVLLERPSAIFLSWLGNLEASILPAAATRTGDTLDGLGPYRVEDEAVVAAGANLPALVLVDKHPLIRPWSPKRIHFVFEKTSAEGIAAVKSGSIDFFPLDGVLYESADLRVLRSKAFDKVWVLTLGKKVAPLLAADRRRCLFGAIDRSAFAPANQGGEGLDDYTEAYGVIPPGQPGRLTKDQLDATPPFAARCAETAPAIDLIYLDGFVGPGMLAWIQRELARVGVAVTPRGLAKRAFITAIVSSDYDLAFFAFGLDVIPEMTLSLFYRQSSPVPLVWMTSPAIDAQLDKTILAETKSERIALIGQFERDLARTPLLIPLLFERSRYLLGNCFKLHERVMSVGNEYFQEVGAIPGCRR